MKVSSLLICLDLSWAETAQVDPQDVPAGPKMNAYWVTAPDVVAHPE